MNLANCARIPDADPVHLRFQVVSWLSDSFPAMTEWRVMEAFGRGLSSDVAELDHCARQATANWADARESKIALERFGFHLSSAAERDSLSAA